MRIESREHDDVLILDIDGKLAGSVGAGQGLSEVVLNRLFGEQPARGQVLLNLSGCTGADSLGIGELISLHVSLANRGTTLKLLSLPEQIRDLLTATQLISMFETFEDERQALESFG